MQSHCAQHVCVHVASINSSLVLFWSKNLFYKINNLVFLFMLDFLCFPPLFFVLTVFLCLSELGLLVKSCIDQGQLVPDDVMSRLILKDLRALENSSWLLDGGSSALFRTQTCWPFYYYYYRLSKKCETAGHMVLAVLS